MIGLIFKLIAMFLVLVFGTLVGLNAADVVKPGTISLTAPDPEPCRRTVAGKQLGQRVMYVHVRWVWHAKAYGWGCFYELEDGSTGTIAPMPR
jgi:hypothetical protein